MSDKPAGPVGWFRRFNKRRLEKRHATRRLLEALVEDDAAIMEALGQLLDRVGDESQARTAGQAELERRIAELQRVGGRFSADAFPLIATAHERLLEPELELLSFLAPSLPSRLALDVGAHHGRFSGALLEVGFEIHAFEPNPAARAELERRFAGRAGFTLHGVAAGAEEGEADLRLVTDTSGRYTDPTQFASLAGLPLPEGLVSAGTVRVPVRRLDTVVRERGLPAPSIVKVDAEGYDLEVLRGLGDLRPEVLLVEFWDDALPFSARGARNRLPDLVAHARANGAPYHLVVFRRWGDDRPAFFSGWTASPERSWGNAIFFRDRALFERARDTLATVLPEARFVSK
jgi:FkbM family methyltransferase